MSASSTLRHKACCAFLPTIHIKLHHYRLSTPPARIRIVARSDPFVFAHHSTQPHPLRSSRVPSPHPSLLTPHLPPICHNNPITSISSRPSSTHFFSGKSFGKHFSLFQSLPCVSLCCSSCNRLSRTISFLQNAQMDVSFFGFTGSPFAFTGARVPAASAFLCSRAMRSFFEMGIVVGCLGRRGGWWLMG